jgi:hypothetical protein
VTILWDAVVSPADLTTFVRAVPVDQAYVLNQILPDRYDEVFDAEFAESVVTTRAAKARAWDAPPMPGRRDTLTTSKVKLPAISQFLARGERDRLELERIRTGGSSLAAIEREIYNDAENNARSVLARVEQLRGDLLADGVITIAELGGLTADFGVPAEHKVTANVLWTDTANADIIGDLTAWSLVYRIKNNGAKPRRMVVSTDVLSSMVQNQALRDLLTTLGGAPPILMQDQLNTLLSAYGLPTVSLVYDAQVVDDSGTPQDILPSDKVILLPAPGVEVGYTQWGMSATALELANAGVQVLPSPAGMVAVVDKDVRPPYRETAYVDSTCMPILSAPSRLFIADVA